MSELGRVEERHDIDMNFYLLSCKAETGLSSDRFPQELRECTPVEIKNSVVEAGNCYRIYPAVIHNCRLRDF
ncbi:MAG: hypothetical protein HZA84_06900 [Thaumarchaeota archaeon]|nr:hypothetical protein [Nitrososphaerota archaeon]